MAKAWVRVAGACCIGLGTAAVTAELAVRGLRPEPRVQTLDPAAMADVWSDFRWKDGVPLWNAAGSEPRQACAGDPAGTRVVLVGDSVSFGYALAPDDTLSVRLAARLTEGGGAWCVRNFAEPGYGALQKSATALEVVADYAPDVVVWEAWQNDPSIFRQAGDVAVDVGRIQVDESGTPRSPLPMPVNLHRLAFDRSAGWRYATLALAERDDARELDTWHRRIPALLDEVRARTAANNGALVVWMAASLARPFDVQVDGRTPGDPYATLLEWGARAGVPTVDVTAAWRGLDPASLGVDTCCHLNAVGTDRVAALLTPVVRAAAAAPSP